ncbi:M20/M25/M40 family metallo-hydrolase [Marinicella gelatinilytica]|uniref:M20/M25/M40 family metallo-hydrolase n=1 Tax=Marinicella gelatinilytica TaxID=2996017 RepID=UPI0022608BB9|nr:M20/M25/M40 family metallo-hydrolase [Marinicella gelatinilytica]MCX7544606.1 M20/M25/M40 family metallo-hydrolase [Marinicella gelatinilytica]
MSLIKNTLILTLIFVVLRGGYELSYPSKTAPDLVYDGVLLESVLKHVAKITEYPHAVGQDTHKLAGRYIERHIQQLNNPKIQINRHNAHYYNVNNRKSAAVTNYIVQYPGQQANAQAVMLMAHYDAARFSGNGAADDAVGVAVALEIFKTYIQQNPSPKNNLMLLITDGEELGLLGAKAFIDDQLRYYDIGAIINLEARGSSGPAIFLPESVEGNHGLIAAYHEAGVPMPVSSSLDAEIYAKMPNDTDVTPFKESGINAFNLAFIDDHFNYHSQNDDLAHLSLNSVAHHLIQSKSLFNYLAMSDLGSLKSNQSVVYFSIPGQGLVSYSQATSGWLIIIAWTMWIMLLILTLIHKQHDIKTFLRGIKPLALVCFFAFIANYILIAAVYTFIPGWKDILQGFPYGGHALINAQIILTLIIYVLIYRHRFVNQRIGDFLFSSGLWLAIVTLLTNTLPGAGFFIIPALLALPLGFLTLYRPHWSPQLAPFLLLIMLMAFGTFIINLPVAMGIWMTPAAMLILVLMLAPFNAWVETGSSRDKTSWLLLIPLLYGIWIIIDGKNFTPQQPLPTSINYLYDVDNEHAFFFHADKRRGQWLADLFAQPLPETDSEEFQKRYKKPLTVLSSSEIKKAYPAKINVIKPLNQADYQRLNITISTHPETDIISIYTQRPMSVHSLAVGGRIHRFDQPKHFAAGYKLLEYHVTDNPEITLQLVLSHDTQIDWQIQSHRDDLLQEFKFDQRPDNQMQKAFIKSDLITTVQNWTFGDD